MPAGSRSPSSRPLALLLAGVALGAVVAAAGLVGAPERSPGLPDDAVARVNGAVVRREDYERLAAAAAQDRREPLDAAMRRHLLDRLVDEELLVQRGLELGLAQRDRKVRADLSMAVITAVTEEHDAAQPSDEELRTFYADNLDFFSGPGRVRLRQVFVRVPQGGDREAAFERAARAAARLRAGEDFAAVRAELGDTELAPVPDALLPPAKLRDYVGPTALHTALGLDPGEVGEPVRSSMGLHVLQVLDRRADEPPPFEEARPQILAEYRRRAGEQALRQYLAEMRARAQVEVVDTPP